PSAGRRGWMTRPAKPRWNGARRKGTSDERANTARDARRPRRAAFHHCRQRRRRQEHADRASALPHTPRPGAYPGKMVPGARTAGAGVILIDATRLAESTDGTVTLLPQTRRHSALVHLLGLRHIVLAVNKMHGA